MTTATQAYEKLRSRLTGADTGILIPLLYQNENAELPDEPTTFAYVEFIVDPSLGGPAAFGGGRGQNRYRYSAQLIAYVFVPSNSGLAPAMDHAETIAARLRSFRDTDVSCFDATVQPGGSGADLKPPGLTSEVGNYFYAVAVVSLSFDQIG